MSLGRGVELSWPTSRRRSDGGRREGAAAGASGVALQATQDSDGW